MYDVSPSFGWNEIITVTGYNFEVGGIFVSLIWDHRFFFDIFKICYTLVKQRVPI